MSRFSRVPPEVSLEERIDGFTLSIPGSPGRARVAAPASARPMWRSPAVVLTTAIVGALWLTAVGWVGLFALIPLLGLVAMSGSRAYVPVRVEVSGGRLTVALDHGGEATFALADLHRVERVGWRVRFMGQREPLAEVTVGNTLTAEWLATSLNQFATSSSEDGSGVPDELQRLRGREST